MIKINLLPVERAKAKKKFGFDSNQKVTLGAALILIATVGSIGWRLWDTHQKSISLDEEIAAAQTETSRLHSIIQQVQAFEQRKAQLQQRVTLIEQLRKDQTGPVRLLDQVSRSLPPMMWLTDLKQPGPAEVVLDGRATTLTGLSDFVTNLEGSGYFKKSVEIISSEVDASGRDGELIKFSLRAQVEPPKPPPAVAGKPAAAKSAER